jgi:hypothetical protein
MWKYVLPLVIAFFAGPVQSQSPPVPAEVARLQRQANAQAAAVRLSATESTAVDVEEKFARAQITTAFTERQIALRRDAEKLLSLAAELKQSVDKTAPSILSLAVVKKAQEIEKLAKSVKDKMKEAY